MPASNRCLILARASQPVPSQPVAAETGSKTPSASVDRVILEGDIPVEVNGEHVYHGTEIAARKAETGPFLVAGVLGDVSYDCMAGQCPGGSVWVLMDPSVVGSTGIPLLVAGGIWVPAGVPRWAGDLVLLHVRQYDAICPWGGFCDSALLVEAAIAD